MRTRIALLLLLVVFGCAPSHHRASESLGGARYTIQLEHGGGPTFGPAVIPPRSFLVMGDNRGNSSDGRSFGLVPREALLGRALGVYARDGLAWHEL